MKEETRTILILFGLAIGARLLRKPVTKAIWNIYTGPKFYAAVKDDLTSNDPVRIQKLHTAYLTWPEDTQSQFNDTVRKLGLRRPW